MASAVGEFLFSFSVHLYKQLYIERGSEGNVVCSPFAVAAALSMTLAGARNNTERQIAKVLQVEHELSIHDHFEALLSQLSVLSPYVRLYLANRIYVSREFVPRTSYADLLRKSYSSAVKGVDFLRDPDGTRRDINAWVENATSSKVKGLLSSSAVDDSTVLVLVNAVYFKGIWNSEFDVERTSREDFSETATRRKAVDMMCHRGKFRMSRSLELGVTALEIPYKNSMASMVVLLPNVVEGLSFLEERLTPSRLSGLLETMSEPTKVRLKLPRLALAQETDLKKTLTAMGAVDLFTDSADLSGMSAHGRGPPFVTDAIHKVVLEVNEEGTEAAAAVGIVVMSRRAIEVVDFTVDHPFLFLVRLRDPGIILFMGSVRRV